jgi:hypothetical protein
MRNVKGFKCIFTIFLFFALLPTTVSAETPVESSVESRLVLAFQVRDSDLQSWIPSPWLVSPVPTGPSKGANLFVAYVQKLLGKTPEGKPSLSGGTTRYVVLFVPAKHAQSGEKSAIVIRVYMTDNDRIPGPYKNAVKADVRREFTQKGENLSPGTGNDDWGMKEVGGGTIVVHLSYLRSALDHAKSESKIRSSVDPNVCYIYRVDQGSELLKSTPSGLDRLQSYEFRSTVPELSKLLDESTKLVSISAIPSYILQVSTP